MLLAYLFWNVSENVAGDQRFTTWEMMMILKKGVGNNKDTDDFRSIFTKISIASVSSQVIHLRHNKSSNK